MKRLLGLFLFILSCLVPTTSAQTSEAQALFEQLLFAEQRLYFEGVIEERIVFPPNQPSGEEQTRFRHPPSVSPILVKENFIFQVSGQASVAGRGADILELIPKNAVSPSWTFWLDEQTGLRLAYEQRDVNGELVARGRYSSVTGIQEYPEVRELNSPSLSELQKRRLALLLSSDTFSGGFVPVALERSSLAAGIPTIRITLWDGLNSAVVLIYPRRQALGEHPYVRSARLRQLTISVLGPVSGEVLESWLERLEASPLRRLNVDQIRNF